MATSKAQVPPHPKVYTLADLRTASFAKPQPVVEDLIDAGETVLMVGRPKMGKSRLAEQLALSLSRGTPFLGRRVPRKFKVLLLDLENRPQVARERFCKMAPSSGDDANILVYAPESLAENVLSLNGPGLASLELLVQAHAPDVLIVDTWRLLIGAADENKSEHVLNGLLELSKLRRGRPNLVILLVHHLRKQTKDGAVSLRTDPYMWVESVSGHHALVGHVDACWGLEREPDTINGGELIVFGGVARNATSRVMILDEDPDTLLFEPVSGEDALLTLLTPKEADFWCAAKDLGRFTFTELQKAVKTTNRKAVTSMLRKAKENGCIEHTGDVYRVLAQGGGPGGTSGTTT